MSATKAIREAHPKPIGKSMARTITFSTQNAAIPRTAASGATTESALVRRLLIAAALLFLGLFLFLPLIVVFSTALSKGLAAYLESFQQPETLAAIRLTLLAAGIAVPLNLVFGVT